MLLTLEKKKKPQVFSIPPFCLDTSDNNHQFVLILGGRIDQRNPAGNLFSVL
jgi:hypothetical protein